MLTSPSSRTVRRLFALYACAVFASVAGVIACATHGG